MHLLPTPYAVSDFTRDVLLSAKNSVRLHLHPRQAALTVTVQDFCMPPREATITCPKFAARLLPALRAAFFRAQAHGQLLTCDAHWLRYQVHTHFLAQEMDYYFAHELNLLDQDAALKDPHNGYQWPCVVLTFGSHQVHLHGASSLQHAKDGDYMQKPFISRLWPSQALTQLQRELQLADLLTQPWVIYTADLLEPIRLRRKLQLLVACEDQTTRTPSWL